MPTNINELQVDEAAIYFSVLGNDLVTVEYGIDHHHLAYDMENVGALMKHHFAGIKVPLEGRSVSLTAGRFAFLEPASQPL